jgi:hypothetical protein
LVADLPDRRWCGCIGERQRWSDGPPALLVLGQPPVDLEAADGTHHGFRALHWIAWHGMTRTCRAFLQSGADIDRLDREGNTPLRIAIRRGQKEVALLLLDTGADPDEMYPIDLHREVRSLLGWASSNDSWSSTGAECCQTARAEKALCEGCQRSSELAVRE